MKNLRFIILFTFFSAAGFGQCIATFRDINNYVYIFDAAKVNTGAMPLLSYKIGRAGIMAYVGKTGV